MCPPATLPIADIEFDCCPEKIMSLLNMTRGCPLPGNVIPDVIPYQYAPSNLPENIWYLIWTKENESTEPGCWKVKGEACKLFSNSTFTGWRTTFEFFEGQVPDERKTDWLMEKYWMTQKGHVENSKEKEATSLFRVFQQNEEGTYVGEQQSGSQAYDNGTDTATASKDEVVSDDETRKLAVDERLVNDIVETPLESDYLSRGDYLELLDFVNPASPSSSSDNSSCMTMSSDERFDSLALLQDLERGNNQISSKDEGCNFTAATASIRPDERLMSPGSPGTFTSTEGNKPTDELTRAANLSTRRLTNARKDTDDRFLQNAANDEGTSSGSSTRSRVKKLKKYSCFMPFQFLF